MRFINLIIIVLTFYPYLVKGQDNNRQFKIGVSVFSFNNPQVTLQFHKFIGDSRFKVSTNYYYTWGTGYAKGYSNGQLVFSQTYPISANSFGVLVNYKILGSETEKFQGLSIGIGPGFYYSKLNDIEHYKGPGIAAKLEYQRVIKNNWYYGAETYWLNFINIGKNHRVGQHKIDISLLHLTVGAKF